MEWHQNQNSALSTLIFIWECWNSLQFLSWLLFWLSSSHWRGHFSLKTTWCSLMSKDLTTSSLTENVSFVSVVPFLSHYLLLPWVFTSSFLLCFISVANCFPNEIYLTDEIPYVDLCFVFVFLDWFASFHWNIRIQAISSAHEPARTACWYCLMALNWKDL